MPLITIDGKQIEVEKGTTVIQAAEKLNIDIPRYCYHPGLSIVGQCRICLVEIEKMPKLQVACYTPVTEGMVVNTNNDRVLKARKQVLEFLLVNHPIDCPVCDQAGECFLQEYYMRHGLYDSKMIEDKNKKHKALDIGRHVILDSERCILCTRCVRFCDEVSKTHELGIFNRGDHAELLPYPNTRLDNYYSVNTVDICPVGALTEKDFRFKARVWYLKETDSVCPGCSTGCNISVHTNTERKHHADGKNIVRLKPRFNAAVNKWWMCDFGRHGFESTQDETRITSPAMRQGDEWISTTWDVAFEAIAAKVNHAVNEKAQIGAWLSPQMTNEDLFVAQKFFGEFLNNNKTALWVEPKEKPYSDTLLIKADKNPNLRGAAVLGLPPEMEASKRLFNQAWESKLAILFIFHHDLSDAFDHKNLATALKNVPTIVFVGPNKNSASDFAHFILPAAAWPEKHGTFTNHAGRVQRIHQAIPPLGDARAEWQIIKRLAKAVGLSIPYIETEDVFNAIARETPAFAGMSYESIGAAGMTLSENAK
jgi:NADH-quinone oxidoreductase subunit G